VPKPFWIAVDGGRDHPSTDHQLIAAARVFTYRFAKADRRCRTRSEILWDAMYEIQHLTYPLMLPSEFDQIFAASGCEEPYTLGERLKKLVGFIRQEHRREFLDELALWESCPPVTSVGSSSSETSLPEIECVTSDEMNNMPPCNEADAGCADRP